MAVAYIALGSNLGDRSAQLAAAAAALQASGAVTVQAKSPLYETEAVADHPQPPYLNAALRVETALSPRALLTLCLEVERALGRQRPPDRRRAARTIDLDLLLHDDAVVDEPGLNLPHPELLNRPFVRIPLARVASPGLRHPLTGAPLDRAATDAGVREQPDTW